MKPLNEFLANISTQWECHPAIVTLDDEELIRGIVTQKESPDLTLVACEDELVKATISFRIHDEHKTWTILGNVNSTYTLFCEDSWPELIRKNFFSEQRLKDEISCRASVIEDCLKTMLEAEFSQQVGNDQLTTGQFQSTIADTAHFSGNEYSIDIPVEDAIRLFRYDVTLAIFTCLWAYTEYYTRIIPRRADTESTYIVLKEYCEPYIDAPLDLMQQYRVDVLEDTTHKLFESLRNVREAMGFDLTTIQQCLDKAHAYQKSKTDKAGPIEDGADQEYSLPDIEPPSHPFITDYQIDVTLKMIDRHLYMGDPDIAAKGLEWYLAIKPEDQKLRRRVAELYEITEDIPKAVEQYQVLARQFAKKGFTFKTLEIYRQLHRLEPERPEFIQRQINLFEHNGMISSALDLSRELVELYESQGLSDDAKHTRTKINQYIESINTQEQQNEEESGATEFRFDDTEFDFEDPDFSFDDEPSHEPPPASHVMVDPEYVVARQTIERYLMARDIHYEFNSKKPERLIYNFDDLTFCIELDKEDPSFFLVACPGWELPEDDQPLAQGIAFETTRQVKATKLVLYNNYVQAQVELFCEDVETFLKALSRSMQAAVTGLRDFSNRMKQAKDLQVEHKSKSNGTRH